MVQRLEPMDTASSWRKEEIDEPKSARPDDRCHLSGCGHHASAGCSTGTVTTGTGAFRTTFSAVLPIR